MTRPRFLILLHLAFVVSGLGWEAQPNQPFLDRLDELWREKDFDGMERIIEIRLSNHVDEPQALIAGFHFHTMVTLDADGARNFSNRILEKAESSGIDDEQWLSRFTTIVEAIEQLSEKEKKEHLRVLHAINVQLDDSDSGFIRTLIIVDSKVLGWKDPGYAESQTFHWEQWKQERFESVRELGDAYLVAWAQSILSQCDPNPMNSLAGDEIPKLLKATREPRLRIVSSVEVRIQLYKFVNTSYGFIVSLDGVSDSDDGFMVIEKITEHVGWYQTQG